MTYAAEISRSNPTCFLFLVDQSGSMARSFPGLVGQSKAQGVADVVNRLLQNLVLKCAKSEGIRDYFHAGVIGYGGSGVGSVFGGALAGRLLVPISELALNPLRVEQRNRKVADDSGGLIEQPFKFPVWFEPTAQGKTPMCQALDQARLVVAAFVRRHTSCYPPMVVNISDGRATDGVPEVLAADLRQVASADGHLLFFNVYLSASGEPIEYPDREDVLPDEYARKLFRMSSVLPPRLQEIARSEGLRIGEQARGFVFNANLVALIRFLDIGTRVAIGVS